MSSSDSILEASLIEQATKNRSSPASTAEFLLKLLERYEEVKFDNAFDTTFSPSTLKADAEKLIGPVDKMSSPAKVSTPVSEAAGALEGIYFASSPLLDIATLPTSAGSALLSNAIAEEDSIVVASIKAEGARVLGQVHTSELGVGVSGNNSKAPILKNPYSAYGIVGGSSGGAASAVASRSAPFALGVDTFGDIRIPASFCGVVGYRPTVGRYFTDGVFSLSETLSTPGLIARSVEDIQLLDAVIASQQVRIKQERLLSSESANVDPISESVDGRMSLQAEIAATRLRALANPIENAENNVLAVGGFEYKAQTITPVIDWSGKNAFEKDLTGVRIGIPQSYFFDNASPEVLASFENFIQRLEKAGATTVRIDFSQATGETNPLQFAREFSQVLFNYESARSVSAYLSTHRVPAPPKASSEEEEEEEEEEDASAEKAVTESELLFLDKLVSTSQIFKNFKGTAAEERALLAQLSPSSATRTEAYVRALVKCRPQLQQVVRSTLEAYNVEFMAYPAVPMPSPLVKGGVTMGILLNHSNNTANNNNNAPLDETSSTIGREFLVPPHDSSARLPSSVLQETATLAASAGLPAISVPFSLVRPGQERLPVSVELLSLAHNDERLLALARSVFRLREGGVGQDPLLLRKWGGGITFDHLD